MLQVTAKLFLMRSLQGGDSIPLDRPVENFFVNIAEKDPCGELRKISVFLDQ